MTVPVADTTLGRAVAKVRRRLDAHHNQPPALRRRRTVTISLPVECWTALLREVHR